MANITELTTWEKHMIKIFIGFGASAGAGAGAWAYARLGKSTVFDIAMNPETETFDFIEDETPTELLKQYKPSMAQEIYLAEGEPAFDELFQMYLKKPVGTQAVRPAMIVYPKKGVAEKSFIAQQLNATISFNNFNPVDKKLTFDMKFANIVNGEVTFTNDKPEFEPDVAA